MVVVITVVHATYQIHLNCLLCFILLTCDLWESHYIHRNGRIVIIIQYNIPKYNRGFLGSHIVVQSINNLFL